MTGTTFTHNNREYIVVDFTETNSIHTPTHILGMAAAKLNTPKARKATKAFMVKKDRNGEIWFDYVSAVRI